MSFEENKDNVENVYEKMLANLPEELLDNKYYQYFYNLLETGNNYCSFFSTKMVKSIDEEWVKAIEEALPALQTVVLNPRKFIEEDREVVNIAMARNISPESILHLLQHSNMIDKINEDGTVVPNRILNVFKEESLNTYENRFVCTLIMELQRFINKRFNVIFDNSKDECGTFFEVESLVDNYTENISYKLEIKIKEKQTDVENEEENMGIFSRIYQIHRKVNDLAVSGFMTTMRHYPPVRHPIVKTNAIGKNLNYKACHKLWNYIHDYDRIGYKVDMVKQEPVISQELERDIYNSFLWDYFMIRNYIEQTDYLNADRPRRKKEITTKYIRQVLDEIINGLDMPDANVRKLIMNELSDLQLKRKSEMANAMLVEQKREKSDRRKKRRRHDR
ncbi:MAG: DUF2357 domain-containing protein [Lachnospiraceae bacterium]|nr:DUF2357 domain-containing protein [Lachnospiraceae bacterium]